MQDTTNNVTDVEFKEVVEKVEEKVVELFNPVKYLVDALTTAGHPNPTAWMQDLDPRAETAESEKDRMFFVNRAVRLYMAEHIDLENITPRLILAEGIEVRKWCALVDQGIVKWLTGVFNKKTEEKKENLGEVQDTQAIPPEVLDQGFNPHTQQDKVQITDGDTDALPEGSMDSLPGSVVE